MSQPEPLPAHGCIRHGRQRAARSATLLPLAGRDLTSLYVAEGLAVEGPAVEGPEVRGAEVDRVVEAEVAVAVLVEEGLVEVDRVVDHPGVVDPVAGHLEAELRDLAAASRAVVPGEVEGP